MGLSLTFTKSVISNVPGNNSQGYFIISGTPNTANDTPYTFTIIANNSGKTVSKNFSLLIKSIIPIWVTTNISNPTKSTKYNSDKIFATYGVIFTQVDGTDLSSIGLSLTSFNGYCEITGVPTTLGDYTFTLRAENSSGYTDKIFNFSINQNTNTYNGILYVDFNDGDNNCDGYTENTAVKTLFQASTIFNTSIANQTNYNLNISIPQKQYTLSGISTKDVWDGCIIPKYSHNNEYIVSIDFNNSFIDANELTCKYLFGMFGNVGMQGRVLDAKMTIKNLNLWVGSTTIPFINEFIGNDGNFVGNYDEISGNLPTYPYNDNTRYYSSKLDSRAHDYIINNGGEPEKSTIIEAQNYNFWWVDTNVATYENANNNPVNHNAPPTYPSLIKQIDQQNPNDDNEFFNVYGCGEIILIDNCIIGGNYTYLTSLNSWNFSRFDSVQYPIRYYPVGYVPDTPLIYNLPSGVYFKETFITTKKSTGWGGTTNLNNTLVKCIKAGGTYGGYTLYYPKEWTDSDYVNGSPLPNLNNTIDPTLTNRSTFITKINNNGNNYN